LTRGDQVVTTTGESSMPLVQVQVSNRVTADRFVTIAPGASVVLFYQEFEKEYDFHGAKTRMKEDYARATLHPLATGKYKVAVSYEFDPAKIDQSWNKERSERIEFDSGAKNLWDSAIRTKISLTKTFEVR
jgi:hypothetical protein